MKTRTRQQQQKRETKPKKTATPVTLNQKSRLRTANSPNVLLRREFPDIGVRIPSREDTIHCFVSRILLLRKSPFPFVWKAALFHSNTKPLAFDIFSFKKMKNEK